MPGDGSVGVARGVSVVGFLLVLVSACGTVAAKPLPLSARLIKPGEFRGYTPGTRVTVSTPEAEVAGDSRLTPAQRKARIARLRREGFKEHLSESLNGPQAPQTGLSGVMQLGSAASARAELVALATELRRLRAEGQITERFSVKAIPGAIGFGYSGPHGGVENIDFADGPFLYFVAYYWYGSAVHNPKHSALLAAATKLYTRVHGHPAS